MTIKRIEVPMPDYIKNGTLIKDLQESEVICEECKGSGLVVHSHVYGLKGEREFRYNKQTLAYCQHCYNGVRTKCKFCDELLQKGLIEKCTCDGYKKYKEKEEKDKELEFFNKATKMTYEEYIEKYPGHMIFDANIDGYYLDLEELEDNYEDEVLELPKYVYGTSRVTIGLNTYDIIENVCEDLYEGAHYNLVGIEELREAAEEFNRKNEEVSATYYPDYKIAIIL